MFNDDIRQRALTKLAGLADWIERNYDFVPEERQAIADNAAHLRGRMLEAQQVIPRLEAVDYGGGELASVAKYLKDTEGPKPLSDFSPVGAVSDALGSLADRYRNFYGLGIRSDDPMMASDDLTSDYLKALRSGRQAFRNSRDAEVTNIDALTEHAMESAVRRDSIRELLFGKKHLWGKGVDPVMDDRMAAFPKEHPGMFTIPSPFGGTEYGEFKPEFMKRKKGLFQQ